MKQAINTRTIDKKRKPPVFEGLKNHPEIRESLAKDANHILGLAENTDSHIPDIISGLRTIASSLNLKADKLVKEIEQ